MKLRIFTDGACSGNPGPGGWAVLLNLKTDNKTLSGGEKETTNNRMELTAESSFIKLSKNYSEGVRHDLTELNEFWEQYEGPVERTSNRINNTYLKANNQKDGVHSYGRMVDLLIAEHRQAHR
jgi:hypothetical protein